MAMQLPVITTNISALPELVEDGVSGLLVPPRDADALAGAIRRLIADSELRNRLGRNARQRVAGQFDTKKNTKMLANLFQTGKLFSADDIGQDFPSAGSRDQKHSICG